MSLSHDVTRAKIQMVKDLLAEKMAELADVRDRIEDLERLSQQGITALAAAKARITALETANVSILARLTALENR